MEQSSSRNSCHFSGWCALQLEQSYSPIFYLAGSLTKLIIALLGRKERLPYFLVIPALPQYIPRHNSVIQHVEVSSRHYPDERH